jgi:hypothetical protein
MKDLDELIKHIQLCHAAWKHSPEKDDHPGKKYVKYVIPSFDMRTNEIYGMNIDGESFFCVNQNRKRDLKKWVDCWLDDKDDEFDFETTDPEMVQYYKPPGGIITMI